MSEKTSLIRSFRARIVISIVLGALLLGLVGGVLAFGSVVQIVKTGPDSALPGESIVFTLKVLKYGPDNVVEAVVWDDLQYAELDRQEIFHHQLTDAELAQLNNTGTFSVDVPYNVPCNAGGHALDNDGYVLATFKIDEPGTGTPGYWMNHPEAWPVESITIGGVAYSKADAIAYMKAPVKKDKTLTMFPALVAARLNVMISTEAGCIMGTVESADAWMADHPVGSGVRGNSSAWKDGEPLYWQLDEYNNGMLCAPSRDIATGGLTTIYDTNDHDVGIPRDYRLCP